MQRQGVMYIIQPEVVTEVPATHDDNDDDNGEYEEEDKKGLMLNLR